MKKQLAIILITSLVLCSCEMDSQERKGTITFSGGNSKNVSGGRTLDLADIATARVSIQDALGNEILTNEILTITTFGQGYLSEQVPLAEGDYVLTEFVLMNAQGDAIYATPIEGSELAPIVNDPLPIEFTVNVDETTTINPEVLAIEQEMTPASFGYVQFGFTEVIAIRKDIMVYVQSNGVNTPTSAIINITGATGQTAFPQSFNVSEAGINDAVIKGGYESYLIEGSLDGYLDFELQLTEAEMLALEQIVVVFLPTPSSLASFQYRNVFFYQGDPTPYYQSERTTFFNYTNGILSGNYDQDYCCFGNGQSYTYSQYGLERINRSGNVVEVDLTYDDTGKPVSLAYRAPVFHTSIYEVSNILYQGNRPVSATIFNTTHPDLLNQVTTYSYDASGRLLSLESHLSDGRLIYTAEFNYSNTIANVIPDSYFNTWFQTLRTNYLSFQNYALVIPAFLSNPPDQALESATIVYHNPEGPVGAITDVDNLVFEYDLNGEGEVESIDVYRSNLLRHQFFNLQY